MTLIVKRNYSAPRHLQTLFETGMDRPGPKFVQPRSQSVWLNLGAGYKFIAGTIPLGAEQGWWAGTPLPYRDKEVGAIWTFHLFEHLDKDTFIATLRECERVLQSGAPLTVVVPHYISEGAYHDLDHKIFFTESTWKNLMCNTYYDGTMERNWKFEIGINLIMGLNVRNLALVSQLIKT